MNVVRTGPLKTNLDEEVFLTFLDQLESMQLGRGASARELPRLLIDLRGLGREAGGTIIIKTSAAVAFADPHDKPSGYPEGGEFRIDINTISHVEALGRSFKMEAGGLLIDLRMA